MNKTVIAALVALVLLAGGVYALTSNSDGDNKTSNTTTQTSTEKKSTDTSSTNSDTAETASVITYDGTSFSPSQTTVKSGDKLTIKNASDEEVDFDSDPHPTHTSDAELNVGPIAAGESKTVTVTKTGTFGVHNHLNPTQKAEVIVQ